MGLYPIRQSQAVTSDLARDSGPRGDLKWPAGSPGSFGAVEAGAVPSVASFEGGDPGFAAGSPFDVPPERGPVPGGLAGPAGSLRCVICLTVICLLFIFCSSYG